MAESYPNCLLAESESVPMWLLWIAGPWMGRSRIQARRHAGRKFELGNSKRSRDLDLGERTPLAITMKDMITQCVKNGYLPKSEANK